MECSSVGGVAGWRAGCRWVIDEKQRDGARPYPRKGGPGWTVGSRTRKIMKMWQEFLFLVFFIILSLLLLSCGVWVLGRTDMVAYVIQMQKEDFFLHEEQKINNTCS